eukprot:c17617_g1_i1.p1 GENE.c17617_g1_i1~~c17617_g1_i1.p1  ORF type:complete len:737 (-),score=209.91 c17617_g1_i1:154-2364(-)
MVAVSYDNDSTPVEEKFTLDFLTHLHQEVTTSTTFRDSSHMSECFQRVLRKCCKKYHITMSKPDLYAVYQRWVLSGKVAPSFIFESMTKLRAVRSWSGVLPISVATDGNTFSCAYDCHFCPNECTALGAPRNISRSYLSSEGTFIRGTIEGFEGHLQVWRRLLELEMMGHPPDKCEMIVLGGTWDCYPAPYREAFITQLFYACNTYHRMSLKLQGDLAPLTQQWLQLNPFLDKLSFDNTHAIRNSLRAMGTLDEEKAANTESQCARIIGIVLETRPDQINKHSLIRKRKLGCTRIQLGIQHTDNEILQLNNRGHGVEESVRAIMEARDACFKVDGHIMPDMPGTTFDKDIAMINRIFCGEDLQLDYCKLYPCLDLPYTKSREWKQQGIWKPMAEHNFEDFLDVMCHGVSSVPPWTRTNRVQRDFPEAAERNGFLGFVSDNIKTNLQQICQDRLEKQGKYVCDIRAREVKNQSQPEFVTQARPYVRCYRANGGVELFLSVEVPNKKAEFADDAVLLGLLRLRFPDAEIQKASTRPKHYLPDFSSGEACARIRELHVYGNLVEVARQSKGRAQHSGVGKFLMALAELVSIRCGFKSIAVISGVGVRQYYESLGYSLTGEGEFMIKALEAKLSTTPLRLFDQLYPPQALLIPIAQLTILSQAIPLHLPRFHTHVLVPFFPWWVSHAYAHIQQGRAQLVIVHPAPKAALFMFTQGRLLLLLLCALVAVIAWALARWPLKL